MSRILPMMRPLQNEIERFDSTRFGVAQKCTFCSDRVDFGIENGLTPGIDPRATPACVNSCIADALHFGDVDDPDSNVSRLLREQRNFRMHAELGTDPGFHYLYGKANDPENEPRRSCAPEACPADICVPAVLNRRNNSIGTGRRPAISSAAVWAAGYSLFTAVASLRYGGLAPLGWAALGLVASRPVPGVAEDRPAVEIHLCPAPAAALVDGTRSLDRGCFLPAGGIGAVVAGARTAGRCRCYRRAVPLQPGDDPERSKRHSGMARIPGSLPLVIVTGLAEGSGLFLAATAQFAALHPLAQVCALSSRLLWPHCAPGSGDPIRRRLQPRVRRRRTLAVLHDFRSWFFIGRPRFAICADHCRELRSG